MTSKELGQQPAFPIPYPKGEWPPDEILPIMQRCQGMTVRMELAKAAMTGILSNPALPEEQQSYLVVGELAVQQADALLDALAKEAT